MKRLFALLLVLALAAAMLTGCVQDGDAPTTLPEDAQQTVSGGDAQDDAQDVGNEGQQSILENDPSNGCYEELLAAFCAVAAGEYDDGVFDGGTGVMEAAMGRTREEGLALVGYAVTDISGDGVPELIIGSLDENDEVGTTYAVYSCANGGEPVLAFEGYARSRMCYAGGNRFVFRGSSGAAYSYCGEYELSANGTRLNCVELWYSYPHDGDFDDVRYYVNHTGGTEEADAEMGTTLEVFTDMCDEFSAKAQPIELAPLNTLA